MAECASAPTDSCLAVLSSPMDGHPLQPGTPIPNHVGRKVSDSTGLRSSSKKKKRPSILPWKNDHHDGEKATKTKPKSKSATDISLKQVAQPGMPPPDSMVTSTTAVGIKGPLADSNPDLDEVEAEKGSDKIKSSDCKKLNKQITQQNKTIETLKKENDSLHEEKHSLRSANKTLEKELKQATSSRDSYKSELDHLKLQHSKDKRRQQHQDHTSELEEKVRRLEAALAERDREVARLQDKAELQDRMLGQVKTGEEETRVGTNSGSAPEEGGPGHEEGPSQHPKGLRGEQEDSSRLKYLALEDEQTLDDAFEEVKPQVKGTPTPRVRSHSTSQMGWEHTADSSPSQHQARLSNPTSPSCEHPHDLRRIPHGSPYLSPRHVVSHTVISPPPPPPRSRSPPAQADISVLQNCLRLALEEKKLSDQKKERVEEELLALQVGQLANAEKLVQVDRELEQAQEKLRVFAAEKAALEGRLESLQCELRSVRSHSSQMEGEHARAAAERDAELKAIGEQNDQLRREIEELKLAFSSKATAESQVRTAVDTAESLKIAPESNAESAKINAESATVNAESAKINAESVKVSGESVKINAESVKVNAESVKVNAESVKVNAESVKVNAESVKVNAESVKVNAESVKVNAESVKVNAESVKVNAESVKVNAESVKVNAESVKVNAESVKITSTSDGESMKISLTGSAESHRIPAGAPDSSKRGTGDGDPPASPLSPQSTQRSATNRTNDKQKVSNKFVHMRAVFEGAKVPGEEAGSGPTRRHSASLVKERPDDQVKEEERAATLPGVFKKDHSPEPKGKTAPTITPPTRITPPPQTTPPPLLVPPPTPSSTPLQTPVTQSIPLVRTTSPFTCTPQKTSAPSQATPSVQTATPTQTTPTVQTTTPTQTTPTVQTNEHTAQTAMPSHATPTAQTPTSSQSYTAQRVARIASPFSISSSVQPPTSASPSTQKVSPPGPLSNTMSAQRTSSPSQTTILPPVSPPQTSATPNAVQPTRTGPSPQGSTSPSRTASQATPTAQPAPPTPGATTTDLQPMAMCDLKGVPLTRVLTPTIRQGEKTTAPQRDSATVSPSRTNPMPTPAIKMSTATITVQKKEHTSPSEQAARTFSTSAPTRTFSLATLGHPDAMLPTAGPASLTTPTFPHRGIVKAEKFTARASSPLYQQGTALATVVGCGPQEEEDTPTKSPPIAVATPAHTSSVSSTLTSTPSSSSTFTPTPSSSSTLTSTPSSSSTLTSTPSSSSTLTSTPSSSSTLTSTPSSSSTLASRPSSSSTFTPTPSSISIGTTTSSVQLRGPHKKAQRPMSYCPQSSTSPASSSSTNLSGLISRLQDKGEEEGPSKVLTTPTSSAFMRVASWTSNGVTTPTPANKVFATSTTANGKDSTQQTNTHPTTNDSKVVPPHTAVNKVVGPPVINKPAGPAVATGPAVAMGPTTVVEKPTVPTALAGKPLQTAAADRVPAKIQRSNTISAFDRNSKKALLLRWCQRMTQDYDNVDIANFAESFADGMAFCALLHHFMPDKIPYHSLNPKEQEKNFRIAFETAASVGIPALLDVDDMVLLPIPDWMSVMTYVSFIYNKFGKASVQNGGE